MAGLSETAPAEPPGLMSRPLQTAGPEEVGRRAPGARKEPQNPCPESIRIAHTVTWYQGSTGNCNNAIAPSARLTGTWKRSPPRHLQATCLKFLQIARHGTTRQAQRG